MTKTLGPFIFVTSRQKMLENTCARYTALFIPHKWNSLEQKNLIHSFQVMTDESYENFCDWALYPEINKFFCVSQYSSGNISGRNRLDYLIAFIPGQLSSDGVSSCKPWGGCRPWDLWQTQHSGCKRCRAWDSSVRLPRQWQPPPLCLMEAGGQPRTWRVQWQTRKLRQNSHQGQVGTDPLR